MLERAGVDRKNSVGDGARQRKPTRSRDANIPDEISCSRQHILRLCSRSRGAASERIEILRRRFPSTRRRTPVSLEEMTVATIFIDNEPRQANPKQNLLHACLSLGYDLPYFCWHPALGSVGACRQCAVKQFR